MIFECLLPILCSSRRKFSHTQLLFKWTGSCQFRWQGWWNITFFWWLFAKYGFMACSQFFLTDYAGSGSCAFAHLCFLNLVRWMGIEPTTDCFRGNRLYLMGYQRRCIILIPSRWMPRCPLIRHRQTPLTIKVLLFPLLFLVCSIYYCCWAVKTFCYKIINLFITSRTVQMPRRLGLSQSRRCSGPGHGHCWWWPPANASHPQVRSCTTLWFDQFAQKVWQSPGRG